MMMTVMRTLSTMVIIVSALTLSACTSNHGADADADRGDGGDAAQMRIADALRALLGRSTETDDCFVIISDRHSGRFVQFAGSATEPLWLDLPFQTLSPGETARAEQHFSDLGVDAKTDWGFNMDLGRDWERGAAIAMDVFREIYEMEGALDLVIEEH